MVALTSIKSKDGGEIGGMEAGNLFFQWGGEKDAYQLPA
jgi:hypothetical protein